MNCEEAVRVSSLRYALFLGGVIGLALPCNAAVAGNAVGGKAPYPVNHNAPLRATDKVVAETPTYVQHRVEFDGVMGDRVPGYLYVPKGAPGKRPAILFQYGSGGSKDFGFHKQFAHDFAAAGFVVLTIDSFMRGERASKDKTAIELFAIQFDRDSFVRYCGDYSRAVDLLISRPEVDPKRTGYVGISWGAITGITFAAHDPRIRVVAALVGGAGLADKILGRSPAEREQIARELDPLSQVGLIAPRPLLMINATADRLISRQHAEMLHHAAGAVSKVIWVDTDHDFRGPDRAKWSQDRDKVAAMVIRFLSEQLGG